MELTAEMIWKQYEKGAEHHSRMDLYSGTEKAYRMYEGDQWSGLEAGGEKMPYYNIIRPIINYRSSMVAMNNMAVVYTPLDPEKKDIAALCGEMNRMAASQWERNKMEHLSWELIRAACIAGDAYMLFYDEKATSMLVDNTDIYFADEMQPDIQKQKYIIIRERVHVEDVKRIAKENGIPEDQISAIQPDEETEKTVTTGDKTLAGQSDMCTGLVYFYKDEQGVLHTIRSTRNCIYKPDFTHRAVNENTGDSAEQHLYPIAGMVWGRKKGSTRGIGECKPIITNQIEINKILARRLISSKMCAYGKPVYQADAVRDPEALSQAGTAIAVEIAANRVTDVVSYLQPVSMSPDVHNLAKELVDTTRELAGAGDAVMGQINPENASGAAIIAMRDQAAIPLNEQTAMYRQFCEDVALIWVDIWAATSRSVRFDGGDGVVEEVDIATLRDAELSVRIDVTPTDAYSKFAVEQSLEAALAASHISFDEYVDALPENSTAPKARFKEIIGRRAKAEASPAVGMEELAYGMTHQNIPMMTGVTE